MQQGGKTGFLLIAAILFAGIEYGTCVKCYSCLSSNAQYGKKCDDAFTNELQAEECTPNLVQSLSQQLHNVDDKLATYLSTSLAAGSTYNAAMVCQKIVLSGPTNTTIVYRGCQVDTGNSAAMCASIMRMNSDQHNIVRFCESCKTDGCNGASGHSLAASAALAVVIGSFVFKRATVC